MKKKKNSQEDRNNEKPEILIERRDALKRMAALGIVTAFPSVIAGCGSGGGGGGGGNNTTTVSGTVLNASNNPVSGAEVTITSDPVVVYTDANGYFSATVVTGDHSIMITSGGTTIYSGSFSCAAGTPLDLGQLRPSSPPYTSCYSRGDTDGYSSGYGYGYSSCYAYGYSSGYGS